MNFLELPLFQSLSDQELEQMKTSGCLRTASYKKNDIIFSTGSTVSEIGIVLSGSVNVENIDFWGNKSILGNMNEGHIFAETYALCREPMMVDAVAASNCEILFLNLNVLQEKNCTSSWYSKIQRSLLAMCSRKNLMLSERIFCTSSKTVRSRLLTYLSAQSRKHGNHRFQIPFDRQQMADYLNLDRSALSKELSRMKKEGILDFHKNEFVLKNEML